MKQKRRKRNSGFVPILLAVCAVLLVVFLIGKLGGRSDLTNEIADGKAYLESLEEKKPEAVQQVRKDIRKAELEAELDVLLEQINSGEVDPFSLFEDYALMGDSRSVGFEYWEFLDPNRVFAYAGDTILKIEEQLDQVAALNPSTVILCYGLNDISIGIWSTPEEYTTAYLDMVAKLRERLPDATIVISSILPARDPAFNRDSDWYKIPDWNVVLENACKGNDILFANCDAIAEEHADLWDIDGIHFQATFYPYWGGRLIETILSAQIDGDAPDTTDQAAEPTEDTTEES